jgi:hypothetical protein
VANGLKKVGAGSANRTTLRQALTASGGAMAELVKLCSDIDSSLPKVCQRMIASGVFST